jgi:hypothetical protein
VITVGIGISVFLIAAGAVLRFAIDPYALDPAIDLHVVGIILLVAGGIGLLFSLLAIESTRTRRDDSDVLH